nr:COR domain-containing protein [Leptolyngbyaceae cyanobacterium MO_188.B28]
PNQPQTDGLSVRDWQINVNTKDVRLNVWDFGGQEIYHTTHQFFLTKRSLYALVADTRKEDTDFYYWLNIVELLSANSPLIVIKNEKQDRQKEINERQLRGEFTNFKETISANFATNRGLPKILSSIQHYISDLPLVGTELPITWIKVREELEKSKYNYINVKDYLDICQDNGFTSLEDKLQLSSYLHDLGVFLHFQNDDLLYKTVILKPTWGTDAVYKVLDNSSIIQNQGRFNRKDLAKIWHEEKYNLMRAELLRLMMNFKLCYEIPSSPGNYIAPQLLSPNRPEYPWDETNNLFLRYEYEFMPKGILTRFIVEMHPWIEKQLLVWKSGIILNKDQARAEVIEHYRYHKGEIQIRVAGKRKKNLLITAMYEFSKIHRSYERLRFNTLVPCNCDFCKSHQFPHFYALKVLYKFLDDKQEQIQCQASYQMINVRNLIDDAVPEPGHVEERNREEVSSRYQNWKSNTTINIYNKNIQEDNKMSNFNISGGNQGAVGDNASASNFLQSSSQQNQTLSEAAQEIKRLLDQLDTSATESEKAAYINDETSPGFKRRVVGALKAAGETAVEEFFIDNPYLNVVKSGIKSWISSGR